MNLSNLSALTGMATGKTHRGKRSRGKGALKVTPQQHLATLSAKLTAGDHVGAKASAFHLVKALHALTGPKAPSVAPAAPSSDGLPSDGL